MLFRECPFLIDNVMLESLNNVDESDQVSVVRNIIKKVLEITTREDEDELIRYYFNEIEHIDSDDEDNSETVSSHFFIPADKIVEVI